MKRSLVAYLILATGLFACDRSESSDDTKEETTRETEPTSEPVGQPEKSAKKQPAGKPTPDGVELEIGRTELDKHGFIQIVGVVKNNTGVAIDCVDVNIEYLDEDGNALASDTIPQTVKKELGAKAPPDGIMTNRKFIPAGESSPFHRNRDIKRLSGKYASQKVWVSKVEPTRTPHPELTLENFEIKRGEFDRWSLSGTIKNTGDVACRSPEWIVLARDKDGKPHDTWGMGIEKYFLKEFPPGESVDFEGGFTIAHADTAGPFEFDTWATCEWLRY